MHFRKQLYISAFLVLLLTSLNSIGQVFPTSGTVTLTPPYSALLGQYTSPGSNKLMFIHTLRDASEPSFSVRYHLRIESSSIKLETKANYKGSSQILYPNVPTTIFGYDIYDYFDINNLDISGITRQELDRTKKLPEGQYEFCLTILDDLTGVPISIESCAMAWIQLKDAPLVISPACGATIIPQGGTNIMFQWQNQGSISPNSALNTSYTLSVEEITDDNVEPLNAIGNRKTLPIFSSVPSSNTTYLYSLADPTLELGKRYVFRVLAEDVSGQDEFKNEGYSQVCHFNYGYPNGGKLGIIEPKENFAFAKKDNPYFKWNASDKMQDGQQVKYKLIITEIETGQDAQTAIANNNPWKEVISSPTSSKSEYDVLLQDTFPKEKDMAWMVVAISGDQEVAQSEIRQFKTPPAIEEFNAGSHLVSVNEITDKNLNAFAGTGQVKIGGEDSAWVDVNFTGLKLKMVSGRYVLDAGTINSAVDMDTIGLKALNQEVPNGVFFPEELQLDKDALKIKGLVKVPLPVSTNSSTVEYMTTQSEWVAFDSYVLKGSLKLDETKNTFHLLDPLGFQIKYNELSELTVSSNKFVLDLKGILSLPTSVKTPNGSRVDIGFSEQDNFNYGKIRAIQDVKIHLVDGSGNYFSPTEAQLDFSENISPGNHAGDKPWTGIYFTKGSLIFPSALDENGALNMAAEKQIDAALSHSYILASEVTGSGLEFEANLSSDQKLYVSTNSFKGKIKKYSIKIHEGTVEPGEVIVETIVPFVSNTKTFDVKLPIDGEGFGKPVFTSQINETIVFDAEDDQRRTEVKVTNLKFDDGSTISMSSSVKNTYTGLDLTKLQGLKVDAAGNVGFQAIGAPMALESSASASLGGIPIDIDSIAFGKVKGNYGIALGASVNLGPAASGKDGPIRTYLVSSVAPQAAVGANADISGEFDAATMTGSVSAEAGAAGSASAGSAASASGEAGAAGSASMSSTHVAADASAGASATIESPMLNSLIQGVNKLNGGILKEHTYTAELGAGAGGGATKTENGFQSEAYVNLDVIVAKAEGKIEFEVDQTWGAIFKGEVAVEGAFIKIKNLEGISGQLIYGMKDNKPVLLLRGGMDVAIGIVTPYIGLKNLGFAIGMHTAPETFIPEDFSPASSVDWNVDMNVPLAVYFSAGIADAVPGFNGLVYEASISGGGYAKGIDINNPSSFTNLSLCVANSFEGGVINIARGPLSAILADKSVLNVKGQVDECFGKTMEATGNLQGNFMITPGIQPFVIPICGEGTVKFYAHMDLGKIANPTDFAKSFKYSYEIGSKTNPLNVTLFCDPGLQLAKGWLSMKMEKGDFLLSTGIGYDLDKQLNVPQIKVGPLGDYIAPYFHFKSTFLATSDVRIPVGNLIEPDPTASFALKVNGQFYTLLGVDYQFLGVKNNVQLGKVNVQVDGAFESQTSGSKTDINLSGEFSADFLLVGKTYNVKHTGSIPISIKL